MQPRKAGTAEEAPAATVGTEELAILTTPQRADETSTACPRTRAAKTPLKPASARRKKVEAIVEPAASVGTAVEQPLAVAAGPKSLTDEMADLNAEVAALRRQLAKKLIEQNQQLRKMLARFDGR